MRSGAFHGALFLGIVLPNMGRVIVDHSTTPPTLHIVRRTRDILKAVGMAAVPLALVFIGTFRRSQLALLGWILLAALDVLSFM